MSHYIHGIRLNFRIVEPDDAEYIFNLRRDPNLSVHLSAPPITIEDQKKWIREYKARELAGAEYYYVIERVDSIRCGVVRIYDIQRSQFTWGSWILDHNKPAKAALDSALLLYRIAFQILNLEVATFDVRRTNQRTIDFHRRFGATELHIDELNSYFRYHRTDFSKAESTYVRYLLEHSNS